MSLSLSARFWHSLLRTAYRGRQRDLPEDSIALAERARADVAAGASAAARILVSINKTPFHPLTY